MKQLSSVMIVNIDGGQRISYTYNTIDDETGELISTNNKKSFFATQPELQADIAGIMNYIDANKLT